MKATYIVLLLAWLSVSAYSREVIDMSGRVVCIPDVIDRVYTDRFTSLMVYALDTGLLCNATFRVPESARGYISPSYYAGKPLSEGEDELILKLKPDVIIWAYLSESVISEANAYQLRLGIPVLLISLDISASVSAYRFMGSSLNRELSSSRIIAYIERYVIPLHERTKLLPVHPRVYYAEGLLGLNTEPSGSLHSRVLDYLHVTNVADVRVGGVHGMSLVSMEQLLLWDPAHIIVWSGYPGGVGLPVSGGEKSTYAHIMSDVIWSRLSAVRAGQVYQVPALPFGWIDRPPSSNCLLGVVWLCWRLHPELLTFDIQVAIREYFELFYHIHLYSVEELYCTVPSS